MCRAKIQALVRTLKIRTDLLKREFDLFSALQGQMLDTTRPLRAALEILQAYRGGQQAFSSSPMASPVLPLARVPRKSFRLRFCCEFF